MLARESKELKVVHGPSHSACMDVSKLLSVFQDCEVAAVRRGYQDESQTLELIVLIQETGEFWHPLKTVKMNT